MTTYRPMPDYLIVEPIHETTSSVIEIPKEFLKENNEKKALSWGYVVSVGSKIDDVPVGSKVCFRDGTYWKNKVRVNQDEIEKGLLALHIDDLVMIVE